MGKKGKKRKLGKREKAVVVTGLSLLILLGIAWDHQLTVRYYKVESRKISGAENAGQVRLLVISDLHSCRYGEGQQELIDQIAELKPDALLYTGDIADDDMPHAGTILLLEALKGRYPAYYVTGNHEFWSKEVEWIKKLFRDNEVTVLSGENTTLEIKGQVLNICGVDDPAGADSAAEQNQFYWNQLQQAFEGIDESHYTVLLAHRPEEIEKYKAFPCDLIVSGHAHGGQWRIPGILNGLIAPNQGFFPEYAGGMYTHGEGDQTTHVVSRGLARESTRVPRFFNPPELVVIDLYPNE